MSEIFDYWELILIPIFFALGWVAARVDMRQVVRESRALPRSYFEGLNFLLNEQSDKAIDSFLEVTRLDSQTIELHFALGNLFRRRGETDRAIRMHQNLIDRDDLPQDLRLKALLELGQDFLNAGLLDRAQAIFQKLEKTDLEEKARGHLLAIYQSGKEWEKAIDLAKNLPDVAKQTEIAQYYCELAAQNLMRSQLDLARQNLDSAIIHNRQCVRASILEGDLFLRLDKPDQAILAWQNVELQNPDYLALLPARLSEAYRKIGQEKEGLALLKGYLARYPSVDLLDAVSQGVLEEEGEEATFRLVRGELQRNPSLLGLERLLSAAQSLVKPESKPDVELAKSIVQGYTRRLSRYHCTNCGFKARQFYWRCPACGTWESMPPQRSEELERGI